MLNNMFFPKLKPPFLSQLKNLISDLEGVGSDWFLSVLLTLLPTFPECREQTSQKLCIKVHRSPHKKALQSQMTPLPSIPLHNLTSKDLLYLSKRNVTWKRPTLLLKPCSYKGYMVRVLTI